MDDVRHTEKKNFNQIINFPTNYFLPNFALSVVSRDPFSFPWHSRVSRSQRLINCAWIVITFAAEMDGSERREKEEEMSRRNTEDRKGSNKEAERLRRSETLLEIYHHVYSSVIFSVQSAASLSFRLSYPALYLSRSPVSYPIMPLCPIYVASSLPPCHFLWSPSICNYTSLSVLHLVLSLSLQLFNK